MNFYKCILIIFTILHDNTAERNPELVFANSLETPHPNSIGLIFLVKINNTSDENDYDVEIIPDQCCLIQDRDVDCSSVNILSGCADFIPKGSTKILKLIAPLLDTYDRKGRCIVYVDSKSNDDQDKRNIVKINFDTRIEDEFDLPANFKHCRYLDEDPLNECKPVNCDTYYNGKKSYFSRKFKRCIEVPACISDLDYPSIVYNPNTNTCLEDSVNDDDLNLIRNLKKHGKSRTSKDIYIIGKFEPNVTEFIDTINLSEELITTLKPQIIQNKPNSIKTESFKSILRRYLINNKWTLLIFSLIITVQCFLICTMLYCLSRTCNCLKEKKVVRKFFNYRQDVSVTTPLIGTSNIDTETDYQFVNESNVEQKIKCYKSCKKENSNVNMSMSDDILSKCLNRRDWKKFKSEAINECDVDNNNILPDIKNSIRDEKDKTTNETKIAFEDEIINCNTKNKSNVVNRVNNEEKRNKYIYNKDVEANVLSEKEIKCHSYNCFNEASEFSPKPKDCYNAAMSKNVAKSISTEKGAQARFSNDSIDDFLSERGAIYLTGENLSKYAFSNDSNEMKPSSSKTSKIFIKNCLSLLHKKSKQSPSSDPGQNKEVHLIHMSKASIYSSSNDSNCMRRFKRNDSRTSF
ncbi:unnamed protein product, partial [Brenthis ino]